MFWLIKTVVLSLVVIGIFHYLYDFLKNNLTQPKIKDLVNHPTAEYNKIYDILEKDSRGETPEFKDVNGDGDTTKIQSIPYIKEEGNSLGVKNFEPDTMQDELSQFLLDKTNDLITTENEGQYNNFSFSMP